VDAHRPKYLHLLRIQQTTATMANIDASNGSVNDGLVYSESKRTGYMFATSLLDMIDFYWSHTGSANSMVGAKVQVMGGSRRSKSVGHKLALTAGIGSNEHKLKGDPEVEFKLGGNDFSIIHGYRVNEFILLYDSFAFSRYKFDGTVASSLPALNGTKPSYATSIYGLHVGTELSLGPLFGKLEYGYQMISTNKSKDRAASVIGYSVGFSW
jgi:hypothetical protein